MKMRKILGNRKTIVRSLAALLLGGICLMPGLVVSADSAAPAAPAAVTSIKGTCLFSGKGSTWSAKLTAKGNGTFDAVYVSTWNGKPLNYVGTIKTDLKTEISGDGKASGGSANGTFEFSGKYGPTALPSAATRKSAAAAAAP